MLDLFHRPLYDIHRAWRAPYAVSSGATSRAYARRGQQWRKRSVQHWPFSSSLAWCVAECPFGKWISVGELLAHLVRGIDLTRSDEDYGGMLLAQAHAMAHECKLIGRALPNSAIALPRSTIRRWPHCNARSNTSAVSDASG